MTKLQLQFIHRFRDRHGKVRHYLRRPGFKAVPLPGEPLSEEFMDAYREALAGQPTPLKPGYQRAPYGSVNAALAGYFRSPEFLALASSTQRVRRNILNRFRTEHGEKRIAMLERRHLADMLADRAATPFAAEHFLTAIRHLMSWCVLEKLRADNPAADMTSPRPGTEGFQVWADQQIADYRARHALGTKPRLALEILLNTGLRRSDTVRVGRQHMTGGVLSIRTQKTGVLVEIPVLPDLQTAIESMPTSNHLTLLVTEYGRPFTAAGFGGWFRQRCNEAGLPVGYAAHGLRKAAATRLADNGATAHQLMAWFGWSNIREAETYTRRADRRRLAQEAGAKLTRGTSVGKP